MKIALCISGYDNGDEDWLLHNIDPDIDVFLHLWESEELYATSRKLKVIEKLAPKKYLVELKKEINYWNCDIPKVEQVCLQNAALYYSRYYASILKQSFEIENNFQYDLVFCTIPEKASTITNLSMHLPEPNSVYTFIIPLQKYLQSDNFYYSDSATSNQLASIFKFFSFIPVSWITYNRETVTPDMAFYFYLTSIGIKNKPICRGEPCGRKTI